ncbi:hypothetical protein [Streptomyces sp. SM8]|uniref:hypothetical protein n=1 Tax=Streptomyces sp. SM8 TaxID=1195457 RepID=UPI0002830E72|nr:hypothetical protein [Streptomyces sp. SM8]
MLRFRSTRTSTTPEVLAALWADIADLRRDIARDRAERHEVTESLRHQLAEARAALIAAETERDGLRAQQLLDTEDRAALRLLLRTARKQQAGPSQVYVLTRDRAYHSAHITRDAAMDAAAAAGAPCDGWSSHPVDAEPPQGSTSWSIRTVPLGDAS